MMVKRTKSILAAVFSACLILFCNMSFAQEKQEAKVADEKTEKKAFDANEVIFGHVLDAHEFHFLSYKGSDGLQHHATIPLPVILYSPAFSHPFILPGSCLNFSYWSLYNFNKICISFCAGFLPVSDR